MTDPLIYSIAHRTYYLKAIDWLAQASSILASDGALDDSGGVRSDGVLLTSHLFDVPPATVWLDVVARRGGVPCPP